ncbi:MAG: ribosome maturation factor RimM [Clostridia bacterium]|nr:ribosome maturation factor RimM [Clostridia bacterium]
MESKLTVAAVLKPQGIRGEIKVKALCDSAEDLKGLKRVFIDGVEYGVLGVRAQGDVGYISLKGVFDRNAAELLRGKEIEALREDMPPLPENRFYIADLTGCAVVTSSGETIGEVIAVTPARTDIYTLNTPNGEVSFAAAEGVIEEVDTQNKKITVNKKRFKEVSV